MHGPPKHASTKEQTLRRRTTGRSIARLQKVRGQPLLGLSTGLPSLDQATSGLRGLAFLGGGPGVGKSALALFIAVHALRKHPDLAALIYSLDMPKTVLYNRLLCQEAGVEYSELMTDAPTQGSQERLDQAELRLRSEILPRLRIVEHLDFSEGKGLGYVIASETKLLRESGHATNVLVIVDIFQLLPVPDDVAAGVDADSHRVKSLQDVLDWSRTQQNPQGFPILAISEIRKGESGRTEISVGDLMGSARLGYSADSVLLLESARETVPGPVAPVRLKVAKGRDGAIRTQIDLLFEHTRSRFKEAPRPPAQKQAGKPKKDAPAQKAGQAKTNPFAGLED